MKQFLAFVAALLLFTSGSQAAGAKLRGGAVKDGAFSSPDGISFTLPADFRIQSQAYTKGGSFRIILRGPAENAVQIGPAIVIDLLEEERGALEMTAAEMVDFLPDINLGQEFKLEETLPLSDVMSEQQGFPVRETLIVLRAQMRYEQNVGYAFGRAFHTDRFLARVFYVCRGAQKTLPDDFKAFSSLFETLVLP